MRCGLKYLIKKSKEYIKQKGIILGIFVLIFKSIYRFITKEYLIFCKKYSSVNEKMILFYSDADFSDNARALSDYIKKNQEYQKYVIYWAVEDVKKCQEKYKSIGVTFVPKYKTFLNELSIAMIKIHMKAKYIMVTHSFLIPMIEKNNEQIYVMLWHGCGYKDTKNKDTENSGLSNFNLALVPGNLFVKTKAKFWGVSEKKLLPLGQPRYNWMLQKNENAFKYAEKFRKYGKKVVIWMPTFRNAKRKRMINPEFPEEKIKQFPLLQNEKDWKEIDNYCGKYEISLLIKLHIYQKEYDIDFSKFSHIYVITNDDIEQNGAQLYEFLSVTDALITDYSSVAFDYLLLDKPIGFVLDDFELYKNTRGFVFENPLEYMPGHHIYSCEQLEGFFKDVMRENDVYKDFRFKVKSRAIYDSGDYCKEILDYLNM